MGEMQLDLVKGTAWVETFAENDPCDTREITDTIILSSEAGKIPKSIFIPWKAKNTSCESHVKKKWRSRNHAPPTSFSLFDFLFRLIENRCRKELPQGDFKGVASFLDRYGAWILAFSIQSGIHRIHTGISWRGPGPPVRTAPRPNKAKFPIRLPRIQGTKTDDSRSVIRPSIKVNKGGQRRHPPR